MILDWLIRTKIFARIVLFMIAMPIIFGLWWLGFFFLGSSSTEVQAAPVEPLATATPVDVIPCLPINSAEGEMLYYCESEDGPDCVWDPSAAMRTGMLDCEW